MFVFQVSSYCIGTLVVVVFLCIHTIKKKEALIPLCMIHLHHYITPVYLLDIVKNMTDDSTIPLMSQTT